MKGTTHKHRCRPSSLAALAPQRDSGAAEQRAQARKCLVNLPRTTYRSSGVVSQKVSLRALRPSSPIGAPLIIRRSGAFLFLVFSPAFLILFLYFSYTFLLLYALKEKKRKRKDKKRPRKDQEKARKVEAP